MISFTITCCRYGQSCLTQVSLYKRSLPPRGVPGRRQNTTDQQTAKTKYITSCSSKLMRTRNTRPFQGWQAHPVVVRESITLLQLSVQGLQLKNKANFLEHLAQPLKPTSSFFRKPTSEIPQCSKHQVSNWLPTPAVIYVDWLCLSTPQPLGQ